MNKEVPVISPTYWKKSRGVLLPLIGVNDLPIYDTYLYWDKYSIDNNQLILKVSGSSKEDIDKNINTLTQYMVSSNCYISEIFDYEGFSLCIIDMSYYQNDIDCFMNGKYSKFDSYSKKKIFDFWRDSNSGNVKSYIRVGMDPLLKFKALDGISGKEYAEKQIDAHIDGDEIIGKFDTIDETLKIEINDSN